MNSNELKALEDLFDLENEKDIDIQLVFSMLKGVKNCSDIMFNLPSEFKYHIYSSYLIPIFLSIYLTEFPESILPKEKNYIMVDIKFVPEFIYSPQVKVREINFGIAITDPGNFHSPDLRVVYKWKDKEIYNSTHLYTLFYVDQLREPFIKQVINEFLVRFHNNRNAIEIKCTSSHI